jgi:hypothetical protein
LVLTRDDGKIDPSFPNWNFNHMIVKIKLSGEGEFWVDPTSKYSKFGELPSVDEGIDVMVINGDSTASMEKTPQSTCFDNRRDINIQMNMGIDDKVSFKVNIKYYGKDAVRSRYKVSDLSEKKLAEYCKEMIIGDFLSSEITNCCYSNLDSIDKTPELNFEFIANNAVQKQGDLYLLNFDPYKLFENLAWLNKNTRKYPLDYGYPFTINKTINIQYPCNGFEIRNKPTDMIKMDAGLKYSVKYIGNTPGALTIEESFSVENKIIGELRYPEVMSFYEKAQNKKGEKIIFTKII